MEDVEFMAPFGDQYKNVKISTVQNSDNGYQIYIDNFFQGTIVKLNSGWIGRLNARSLLTGDDILILTDLIESKK